MQPGKVYYFIVHAYHHFIARLDEITGPQKGRVSHVYKIHSSTRGWTEFFEEGAGKAGSGTTNFMKFPPGEITWMAAFDWNHPYPE